MDKNIPPPKKPNRVSVPVSPEVLAIFERLGKASNLSAARVIAEWLNDTVEAAEMMASTMERARAAPKVVTAELHAMMLGMSDMTKELSDKYAKFKGPMGGGGVGGGSVAAERDGSDHYPPPCNTGGKVPTQRAKAKHKKGTSPEGKA